MKMRCREGVSVGLDIGTSKICALAVEGAGRVVEVLCAPNDADVPGRPFERMQDPDRILAVCEGMVASLRKKYPVKALGLTGQMHGILYLDGEGRAVSPFYTWQDGRGAEPAEGGLTYAGLLSGLLGRETASGYGLTTHFYQLKNGCVPEKAVKFCGIHGYVAMRLAGRREPLVHVSDAASYGGFDVGKGQFLTRRIGDAGMDPAVCPEVTAENVCLGRTRSGIAVALPIGDNQASVLGSLSGEEGVLVNVGTGSQVSRVTDRPASAGISDESGQGTAAEIRPYLNGKYLAVGSALCGGHAYAILRRFFEETAALFGGSAEGLYDRMNAAAAAAPETGIRVDTRFKGTREDPGLRGSIAGIGADNLTPGTLARGFLAGSAEELFGLYRRIGDSPPSLLVGSGNGLRRNPVLRNLISERFGAALLLPETEEEAAFGAAMYASMATGTSPEELQTWIRYGREA